MAVVNVEVTQQVRQADPPADYCVNQLHFQTAANPQTADYQALADAIKNLFWSPGHASWALPGRGGYVRIYDRADPKPRPIKAQSTYTPVSWETAALGPRPVCLCLSFYSAVNAPKYRGRIYVNFATQSQLNQVADSSAMQQVLDLGKGINGVGGLLSVSWNHGIWSVKDQTFRQADHYWVNEVWDYVHSRAHKEQNRLRWSP